MQRNSWLDVPITWRSYFRVYGVMTLLYMIVWGVIMAVSFWEQVSEWCGNVLTKVKHKLKKLGSRDCIG